jgi:hypothetical protein
MFAVRGAFRIPNPTSRETCDSLVFRVGTLWWPCRTPQTECNWPSYIPKADIRVIRYRISVRYPRYTDDNNRVQFVCVENDQHQPTDCTWKTVSRGRGHGVWVMGYGDSPALLCCQPDPYTYSRAAYHHCVTSNTPNGGSGCSGKPGFIALEVNVSMMLLVQISSQPVLRFCFCCNYRAS